MVINFHFEIRFYYKVASSVLPHSTILSDLKNYDNN